MRNLNFKIFAQQRTTDRTTGILNIDDMLAQTTLNLNSG
jgi:hypothetical protein